MFVFQRRGSQEGEGVARAPVAGTGGRTEELRTHGGSFGAPLSPSPSSPSSTRSFLGPLLDFSSLPCPSGPRFLLPLLLSPPFLLSSPHPCSSLGICSCHLPCCRPALTRHSGLSWIWLARKSSSLDRISRLHFPKHLERGLTLGSFSEKGAMMAGQVPKVNYTVQRPTWLRDAKEDQRLDIF